MSSQRRGTKESGRGTVIRRIQSFEKAAEWLKAHKAGCINIETRHTVSAIAEPMSEATDVRIVEGSSERLLLPDATADIILTDPPFHDDVQYHELSLPLRAWSGLSIEALKSEVLVNAATGQNVREHEYANLLLRIFREACRVLRPNGHLIFSYANREPFAWRAVFTSLEKAGFRAAGYAILHSENETDVAKRDVRACSLNLLMDLIPTGDGPIKQWRPTKYPDNDEGHFLKIAGDAFLCVGGIMPSDLDGLERALEASSFLRSDQRKK